MQEVFLALWRDRDGWEIDGSVRSWLYGAARNHALNHLRHARVVARFAERGASGEQASEVAQTVVAMGAPPIDAHDRLEQRELDAAIGRALAALPERRRVAMLLRWKHDLAPGEIAQVLGTTPANVRVLLTRARQELGQLLGRGSSPASL